MKVVWVYAFRDPAHRTARGEHTDKHRELARDPRALRWLTAALSLLR